MKIALLVVVSLYLLFWNLGSAPLNEWDESRYAENAFEMARNHDYVNYFYQGHLDLWNAKPPLQVWSILAASKMFGENAFALRLPAALGGALTLLFVYLLGEIFGVGLWCAWIALGTKALIGLHVARTGDMDGLFLGLLAGGIYFFVRGLKDRPRDLLWSALFFGLSFMQKGFASLIVVPALAVLFFQVDWKKRLRPAAVGLAIFALFPIIWILVSNKFGLRDPNAEHGSSSAVGVMIFYDIFARVFGNVDGAHNALNPQEIFRYLDIRFSPWFYALIVFGVGAAIMRGPQRLLKDRNHAFWISGLITGVILFAVAFTRNKHDWYPTPAIITMPLLILVVGDMWTARRAASILFALAIVTGVAMRVMETWRAGTPSGIQLFATTETLRGKSVHFDRQLRQDEQVYMSWAGANAVSDTPRAAEASTSYKLLCTTECRVLATDHP